MISAEIKAWLTVIAVVVVVVGGSLFWAHYSGIKADLKAAEAKVAVLEENLKTEKETTKKLGSDLSTANAQTDLTKELYTSAEKARVAQANVSIALTKKIKQMSASLPVPARKQDVAALSTEEETNSYQRISTLWDVYCVTNPENEKCTVIQSTKPVSSIGDDPNAETTITVTETQPEPPTVLLATVEPINLPELVE